MVIASDKAKRHWKKGFRKRQQSASNLGQQADQQIEKFLIRRFERLISVRKFVLLWVGFFVALLFVSLVQLRALGPYYQTLQPVPGGIYSEGLIGTFSNANPIYATNAADIAISRLVFSGLLKYDKNNELVGDLASKWRIDPNQTRYTVSLKQNVYWHDGKKFDADDVVFTYQTIQNREAQSSISSNWDGVKVTKKDPYTVNFDLSRPLGSFPNSLTNGIIPKHSFKELTPAQMRSAQFNTSPIGTGPFIWKSVQVSGTTNQDRQQRISLAANDRYHLGKPKLGGLSITTFSDDQHLISAFNNKQLNAMSGLDSLPDELRKDPKIHVHNTPLTSTVMAFFNVSNPILSDVNLRRALVRGVDRNQIPQLLPYPAQSADSPFFKGQFGYDPAIIEPPFDKTLASQLLDQSGWANGASNIRAKAGQELKLSLASQNTQEYTQVAQFLQKQWGQLGVKLDVNYYTGQDLQAAIIANHSYDILLYGINIGVDPDVFAYWDSSQANVSSPAHFNLSEYRSTAADQALQAGRTRSDPEARISKYKAFLASWVQDAPALALYQPNSLYISRGPVFNFDRKSTNSSSDRFYNVNQWMIRQRHQTL